MRADLSRRNRHLDSVVPKKWRSPAKSYMDVTASENSSSAQMSSWFGLGGNGWKRLEELDKNRIIID